MNCRLHWIKLVHDFYLQNNCTYIYFILQNNFGEAASWAHTCRPWVRKYYMCSLLYVFVFPDLNSEIIFFKNTQVMCSSSKDKTPL